jgi:predicted nucleotidyltransferase
MKLHTSLLDALDSKTKVKIIKFLLTHQASMSEREIASILKVSHMSINRAMRGLFEVNFVDYSRVGKAHLWRVNHKSYAFKVFSSLLSGGSKDNDPFEDLKRDIVRNLPKTLVKQVILFGSVAEGSEKTDSDIDLFILVKDQFSKGKLEKSIEKLSKLCLEIYGNRLAPYVLTKVELEHKKNLSVISEIKRGIVLFPKRTN